MNRQIAGRRRSRRKSVRKTGRRQSKVSGRRSKCNRRSGRRSCNRRSKGKKRCSWVKRKSSGRRKHKGYCKKMSGGSRINKDEIEKWLGKSENENEKKEWEALEPLDKSTIITNLNKFMNEKRFKSFEESTDTQVFFRDEMTSVRNNRITQEEGGGVEIYHSTKNGL